ncbi:hypothetical protein FRC15_008164 [Serendipita sp. 397]|nr:hypothetical protein FRC15_008164 [Serendipita sp. 397]
MPACCVLHPMNNGQQHNNQALQNPTGVPVATTTINATNVEGPSSTSTNAPPVVLKENLVITWDGPGGTFSGWDLDDDFPCV